MSATDPTLLQVAAPYLSGVGAVALAVFTYHLGKRQVRDTRRHDAARAFRTSVNKSLADVPPANVIGSNYKPMPDPTAAFLYDVGIAVNDFKPYLSEERQAQFAAEWLTITKICEVRFGGDSRMIRHATPTTRDGRLAFHAHVAILLKFAPAEL